MSVQPEGTGPAQVFDSTSVAPHGQAVAPISVGGPDSTESVSHSGMINNLDQYLYKQFIATETLTWTVTQPAGTILYKIPIHPTRANQFVQHLCKMYNVYVGGLDFNVKIAGTGFHAGALGVARLPPNVDPATITTLSDITCFEYQVIDAKTLEVVSWSIMDQRNLMYHYLDKFDADKPETFGGWFIVFVNIGLNTSATGSQQIQVQVYNKLAMDFMMLQIRPIRELGAKAPTPISPYMDILPDAYGRSPHFSFNTDLFMVVSRGNMSLDNTSYQATVHPFGGIQDIPKNLRQWVCKTHIWASAESIWGHEYFHDGTIGDDTRCIDTPGPIPPFMWSEGHGWQLSDRERTPWAWLISYPVSREGKPYTRTRIINTYINPVNSHHHAPRVYIDGLGAAMVVQIKSGASQYEVINNFNGIGFTKLCPIETAFDPTFSVGTKEEATQICASFDVDKVRYKTFRIHAFHVEEESWAPDLPESICGFASTRNWIARGFAADEGYFQDLKTQDAIEAGLLATVAKNDSLIFQIEDRKTGLPLRLIRLHPRGYITTTSSDDQNVIYRLDQIRFRYLYMLPVTTPMKSTPEMFTNDFMFHGVQGNMLPVFKRQAAAALGAVVGSGLMGMAGELGSSKISSDASKEVAQITADSNNAVARINRHANIDVANIAGENLLKNTQLEGDLKARNIGVQGQTDLKRQMALMNQGYNNQKDFLARGTEATRSLMSSDLSNMKELNEFNFNLRANSLERSGLPSGLAALNGMGSMSQLPTTTQHLSGSNYLHASLPGGTNQPYTAGSLGAAFGMGDV